MVLTADTIPMTEIIDTNIPTQIIVQITTEYNVPDWKWL